MRHRLTSWSALRGILRASSAGRIDHWSDRSGDRQNDETKGERQRCSAIRARPSVTGGSAASTSPLSGACQYLALSTAYLRENASSRAETGPRGSSDSRRANSSTEYEGGPSGDPPAAPRVRILPSEGSSVCSR